MPVVVTGADTPLGRVVVDLLLAGSDPGEVRATVARRSAVADLVARGVRAAVCDLLDPARLGAVLDGAHTVVHLDGHDPASTLPLVADAAAGGGVRRLVVVATAPPPGAATLAADGYDVAVVVPPPDPPDPCVLAAAIVAADRSPAVPGVRLVPS